MSTSMATSKPMGMQKRDYQQVQQLKAEETFKFDTNQRLQNLQFAMDKLSGALSEAVANQGSDKKDCDIEIENVMQSCMSSLKEFRGELNQMFNDINNVKSWVKQTRSEVEDCVETSNFNEKISHLHDCIKKLHTEKDSMRKEFNGLLDRQKCDFEAKLKALKEEILAIPSEVPNLRKVVDQKIELVELNGQNAVLRSSNNENKIMLVERKIENIYQLIKKIEITMQGDK